MSLVRHQYFPKNRLAMVTFRLDKPIKPLPLYPLQLARLLSVHKYFSPLHGLAPQKLSSGGLQKII